jgi:D-arabinose 1-dehydrogenase-like Zn-dependent alcohol dehydrogenase
MVLHPAALLKTQVITIYKPLKNKDFDRYLIIYGTGSGCGSPP